MKPQKKSLKLIMKKLKYKYNQESDRNQIDVSFVDQDHIMENTKKKEEVKLQESHSRDKRPTHDENKKHETVINTLRLEHKSLFVNICILDLMVKEEPSSFLTCGTQPIIKHERHQQKIYRK